jgi:Spy/CpxP family protein refolding chaperone
MRYAMRSIGALLIATAAAVGTQAQAADANPADIAQADKFLKDLPKSCGASSKSVGADGAVTIRIKCDGNGKKMDGIVAIKDGIVTRVE